MSENLIEKVAGHLAIPVTPLMSAPVQRTLNAAAAEAEEGATVSIIPFAIPLFASDDAV